MTTREIQFTTQFRSMLRGEDRFVADIAVDLRTGDIMDHARRIQFSSVKFIEGASQTILRAIEARIFDGATRVRLSGVILNFLDRCGDETASVAVEHAYALLDDLSRSDVVAGITSDGSDVQAMISVMTIRRSLKSWILAAEGMPA